jgi:hypothetical protein
MANPKYPEQDKKQQRADNLLPASSEDEDNDGRFSVAEEVNLDQQSNAARRIGQMPDAIEIEAGAEPRAEDEAHKASLDNKK